MSKVPTISIVIPTRNRRVLLAETINSILAQTLTNWELLVVDDASEDDTFAYVSGLADRRIKVVRLAQHAERSVARNVGLDSATGEFIFFLDDDDLLFESGLQTHVEAFAHHPTAIASVGNFVQFDERGVRLRMKFVRRRHERNLWPDILLGWSPACGRCLFRTLAVKSVQGWNPTYNICEDHELWLRLSRLGPVVLLPETVYMYRVHHGQWRPPKRQLQKLSSAIRQRAVKQLHGYERQRAEQIFAARAQQLRAMRHYHKVENFSALVSFVKVVRLFPPILTSPIMGPKLRRRIMRCLIGGKPVTKWWRRITNRTIDYAVRSIQRSSISRLHLEAAALAARQNDEDD